MRCRTQGGCLLVMSCSAASVEQEAHAVLPGTCRECSVWMGLEHKVYVGGV